MLLIYTAHSKDDVILT